MSQASSCSASNYTLNVDGVMRKEASKTLQEEVLQINWHTAHPIYFISFSINTKTAAVAFCTLGEGKLSVRALKQAPKAYTGSKPSDELERKAEKGYRQQSVCLESRGDTYRY